MRRCSLHSKIREINSIIPSSSKTFLPTPHSRFTSPLTPKSPPCSYFSSRQTTVQQLLLLLPFHMPRQNLIGKLTLVSACTILWLWQFFSPYPSCLVLAWGTIPKNLFFGVSFCEEGKRCFCAGGKGEKEISSFFPILLLFGGGLECDGKFASAIACCCCTPQSSPVGLGH